MMTKSPFIRQSQKATDILELVNTDVYGPYDEMTRFDFYTSIPLSMAIYGFTMCI